MNYRTIYFFKNEKFSERNCATKEVITIVARANGFLVLEINARQSVCWKRRAINGQSPVLWVRDHYTNFTVVTCYFGKKLFFSF